MSVEILEGRDGKSAMYCDTTGVAFGPVFLSGEDPIAFQTWLKEDPRKYTTERLVQLYVEWVRKDWQGQPDEPERRTL
jgi:hypothetical protein